MDVLDTDEFLANINKTIDLIGKIELSNNEIISYEEMKLVIKLLKVIYIEIGIKEEKR